MCILNLTHGFNRLRRHSGKTKRETFKFGDLMLLILEIWRYIKYQCKYQHEYRIPKISSHYYRYLVVKQQGICYLYIPGTLGPCFHYWCSVYGICKWSDTLWPVGSVRLFSDYTISLSSLCRLIWRHWTTKMLAWYRLPSVCLRLRQFSQLSFIQYMGLYVFSSPNSPVMIMRICTLSYHHHQIGNMTH